MTSGELLLTLLGAVALLLWGVRMVRTGMTRTFGPSLRTVLGRASANRFVAFGAGVGVTALLQSATATVLLLSSFAGRGLIALPIALAMILGADVGTTLVAQVFAFDVKWLWAGAMVVGVGIFSTGSGERVRGAGRIAIGLGLMLLALKVLGDVGDTLRASSIVKTLLGSLDPMIAVVCGALLTWLAHSSLAVVLLVMSLTGSGAVDPLPAIALVLGANIGGSIAPFVALADAPTAARRVALGNLLARLAVAVAVLPALPAVLVAVSSLSAAPERLAINFHTLFNFAVAIVFLPLTGPLATAVRRLLPEPATAQDPAIPQHLDPSALTAPAEALGCAMRETLHVGDIVLDMLRRSLTVIERNDAEAARELEKADDVVDRLHEAIKLYLIRSSRLDLNESDARRYVEILTFNTNLEHIGDIIDKNLMELATKKIKKRYAFSAEGLAELKQFHARVVDNLRLALNVFATRDVSLARRLLAEKTAIRTLELELADRHFERLRKGLPQSIETSAIHLDVIRDLKRINSHITSVAYPILEVAGELRESRLRDQRGAASEIETKVVSRSPEGSAKPA